VVCARKTEDSASRGRNTTTRNRAIAHLQSSLIPPQTSERSLSGNAACVKGKISTGKEFNSDRFLSATHSTVPIGPPLSARGVVGKIELLTTKERQQEAICQFKKGSDVAP